MVVNENNPKIWASLIAPNPDDVTYWVDLTADPHGNIIKFYDENDEKWYNLTSPTSDYAVYPYIGPNGNWFIENKDSGISASGEIPNATINGYLLSTNPVLNKYDIGLGNVANLAPEEYPIPDGVYDLVAGKVDVTRKINGYSLSNDIDLTKSDVGLSNVSNLAPADLPISTATQTALNGKVNTSRQVIAGTGLTGGGALTSDVTLNIASGNDGIITSADAITLNTVNNLTSISVTQPLSAAQGKVLQDGKINNNGTNSNIDVLHFNPTTLTALSNIGDVRFSDESKTLEVKVSDTVSIQLGQETQARVKNNAGVLISNGQVVYIDSASGSNPLAKIATTADPDIAQRTFGMATEDIAINGFGAITTEGLVRDVNTSSFTEGAMLWLSTNGSVTATEPVAPTPKISIGMVLRSNATNGVIYVKIRAIARNSKLSDVYAPTLANGNILRWNSTTSRFEVWDSITALANKVDVVAGKGLSTNDYTTTEKNKLAGIATGAEVNVNADWNATSGDAQILNKPTTLAGYGITNAYTKTETDLMMTAVYKYKGVVATSANLPSTGMVVGDVWNVTDININYAWDGSAWDPLGGVVGADVSLATPTTDGLLSASDFVKLSGIAAGAEVNVNPDWNAVSGDAQILNKPTTISGYGITNAYTKTEVDTSLSGKEPVITAGTTSQYWRGDKSWQTLNKSAVGLSLVENTALSTWAGSTNISTVGTITNGTWSGSTIGISKGGTNLTSLGTANQLLRVNSGATALEYFTPTWTSNTGTVTSVSMTVPTGLTITGSPITTAGTLALSITSGYSIPTTEKQGQWDTAYSWGSHAGLYQPIDADLTAIAGLTGTSGILKKTAANTWSLDTSTYLTGNQTITLSGAVSGSGTTAITTSYATTVPTTKGGTGLTTLGTAGQVLRVNTGATGLEWATITSSGVEVTSSDVTNWNTAASRASYMLPLVNRSNTMVGVPATAISGITNSAEIIYAELSANATLGYFEHPSPGQDVHLIIKNTSASAITITIPNTGNYTSLSGTSLSISAGGFGEINTLCYATSKYLIRAL